MSTDRDMKDQTESAKVTSIASARPRYEAPRITPMSEKDVLKSFQVTSAAASWWGM